MSASRRQLLGGLGGAVAGVLVAWVLLAVWVGLSVEVLQTSNLLLSGLGTAVALFLGTFIGTRVARAAGDLPTLTAAVWGSSLVVLMVVWMLIRAAYEGTLLLGEAPVLDVVLTVIQVLAAVAGGAVVVRADAHQHR